MTKYEICQLLAEINGLPLEHMVGNDSNDPNASGKPSHYL
jgi:S-adenosylmethionine synthetase